MTTEGPRYGTSVEVFDAIRERATTMLKVAFMESGMPWQEELYDKLLKVVLGVGIAAASEHYASHPEHLAWAGSPVCTACGEKIETLQAGIDPVPNEDGSAKSGLVRMAWPCGHIQADGPVRLDDGS